MDLNSVAKSQICADCGEPIDELRISTADHRLGPNEIICKGCSTRD